MSDIIWVALIAGGFSLVPTVISFITSRNVANLKHEMNSMKDALVTSTAKASFAEGAASQRPEVTPTSVVYPAARLDTPSAKQPK